MKKITLAILAAVGTVGSMFAQPNINVLAPAFNAQTGYRLPNGTFEHKTVRGVALIKASELSALTGSLVNNIGVYRLSGTSPASASGTWTLWLQNTNDASYTKSTTFATALSGMTQVYAGNFTVPTSTAAAFYTFPCTPTYTYNMGMGMYVAWAYDETTPASNTQTAQAIYAASNIGTGNSLCASAYSSVAPAPTMTLGDFRPSFTFSAVNTATNEVSVIDMQSMGFMSKLAPGNTVTAIIRNNSIGTLTNITPSFVALGANATLSTTAIPSIAGGGTAQISFAYNPTAVGMSTLGVVLAADQNTNNNTFSATQSVTCSEVGKVAPIAASNFTAGSLGGGSNSYIFSNKWTPSANCSLTGVACVVPSYANAANSGKQIYPVLLDATGNIIATGNTITIAANMMDTYYTYDFPNNSLPALTAGTPYLIGIGMVGTGFYPVGYADPGSFIDGYYVTPVAGGSAQLIDYGWLSLKGVITNTSLSISSTSSRSVMCVNEKNTLTVTGPAGATFQWSSPVPTASNTASTVVVTPTLAASTTSAFISYSVTGNVGGCTTNVSVLQVKVSKCTGVNELDNAEVIGLYPNPTAKATTITGLNSNNVITVFNTIGQVVLNEKAAADTHTIDLSTFPAGTYLVRVTDGGNSVKTLKVVKQD
jgi:hypothetical protein